MNFSCVSTLQHIVCMQVSSSLLNQDDVKILISDGKREKWTILPNLKDTVWNKISQFAVPRFLKLRLLSYIEPLSIQMKAWMDFNESKGYYEPFRSERDEDLNYPCRSRVCKHRKCLVYRRARAYKKSMQIKIYWTSEGVVDKKKMAKILIERGNLSVAQRFELACINCLEDYISPLWQQLPKHYYADVNDVDIFMPFTVLFWLHSLNDKLDDLLQSPELTGSDSLTMYEFAFQQSVVSGDEIGAKYFLQKLTMEEKEKIFLQSACKLMERDELSYSVGESLKSENSDMLKAIILFMNEKQLIELFKVQPCRLFKSFFRWPMQEHIVNISQEVWADLSYESYRYVRDKALRRIAKEIDDYDYQLVYRICWQHVPMEYKKCLIDSDIDEYGSAGHLFKILNEQNVAQYLRDAVATMGMDVIFEVKGIRIFHSLIRNDLWELVSCFVQECKLSKDNLTKCKSQVETQVIRKMKVLHIRRRLDKWFAIIDELLLNISKKPKAECDENPRKKLCSGKRGVKGPLAAFNN